MKEGVKKLKNLSLLGLTCLIIISEIRCTSTSSELVKKERQKITISRDVERDRFDVIIDTPVVDYGPMRKSKYCRRQDFDFDLLNNVMSRYTEGRIKLTKDWEITVESEITPVTLGSTRTVKKSRFWSILSSIYNYFFGAKEESVVECSDYAWVSIKQGDDLDYSYQGKDIKAVEIFKAVKGFARDQLKMDDKFDKAE